MNEKTITVTKTSTEKVEADTVEIVINATGEAKKYAEATEKACEATRAIAAAFGKVKLDVKSRGSHTRAVREGNKIVGYRAVDSLVVRMDADKEKLGAALEILGEHACEWNTSYSVGKKKTEGLLARAVEQARHGAEIIAAAANVKLGGLVKVEYSSSDFDRPMLMRAAVGGSGDPDPELVTLSETVTCTWAVE